MSQKPRQIRKNGVALGKLAEEDPTFRVRTDEETLQVIISGMGELHLDIIVDRMRREFKVEANVGKPQVRIRKRLPKRPRQRESISNSLVVVGSMGIVL